MELAGGTSQGPNAPKKKLKAQGIPSQKKHIGGSPKKKSSTSGPCPWKKHKTFLPNALKMNIEQGKEPAEKKKRSRHNEKRGEKKTVHGKGRNKEEHGGNPEKKSRG